MTLADLLAQAAAASALPDETDLARVHTRLFGALRATGWVPREKPRSVEPLPAERIPPPGKPAERVFPPDVASSLASLDRLAGDPSRREDAALLAAFVGGDAAAFHALFERHAPRLNGWARRWLQGSDAEDAVQGAFVVLFEKAPSILKHEDVNVAGFLFTALRYGALRAMGRREVPEAEPSAEDASPGDDGLAALLRREEAGRLAALLERTCNPLEQHVVMLDLEDRDDAEIAAALEITAGYVRVLRHRARGKLRRALAA